MRIRSSIVILLLLCLYGTPALAQSYQRQFDSVATRDSIQTAFKEQELVRKKFALDSHEREVMLAKRKENHFKVIGLILGAVAFVVGVTLLILRLSRR